jgi:hypothetical protein
MYGLKPVPFKLIYYPPGEIAPAQFRVYGLLESAY